MSEKLTKLEQLPPTFKNSKYLAAKDFEVNDWFRNLYMRYMLFYSLAEFFTTRDDGCSRFFIEKIRTIVDQILENPFDTDVAVYREFGPFDLDVSESGSTWYTTLLDISEVLAAGELIREDQEIIDARKELESMFNTVNSDWETPPILFQGYSEYILSKHPEHPSENEVFLCVRLDASNEILEEEFKQVIDKARVERNILTKTNKTKKRTSQERMARWFKQGVLQYMDLKAWAYFNNKTISDSLMGQAIFGKHTEKDGAAASRRTTKKIVNEIMTYEYMHILNAETNYRARERSNNITNKK